MVANWSSFIAAFLASLVEFVEALTIVLAAGALGRWRSALIGSALAAGVLTVSVILFGPYLTRINIPVIHLILGFLLLLFGLRWLKKSVLRSAGIIKLHDEAEAYDREASALKARTVSGRDTSALLTAFNGVFVEGVEVVFIVTAIGATNHNLIPPAVGAAAAALVVIAVGAAARQPLTSIPENALKMCVGILICSFGTFWVGEGLQITWPGSDFALAALTVGYAVAAGTAIQLCKTRGLSR